MSLIKSKGTKPELAMARALRSSRIRYRSHAKLPGTPDLVIAAERIAIFVDGDFWHGRNFDQLKPRLDSFWNNKIASNIRRDVVVGAKLRRMGWLVVRLWEKDVMKNNNYCMSKVRRAILSRTKSGECT
jgi:DNA mismatch endonuclease (patch repair protein)